MKKILNLFILLLLIVVFQGTEAGRYGGTNTSYNLGGNPGAPALPGCNGGNDVGCYRESTPHQTYCFNPLGGKVKIGDNAPTNDKNSAVFISTLGPDVTNPIVSDNRNLNYSASNPASIQYLNDTGAGSMTCYYWDGVKVDISKYELYDYNFNDDSDPQVSYYVADSENKEIIIDFQLSTEIDGNVGTLRLDSSTGGIDTIDFTFTFLDNTDLDQFNNFGTAVDILGSSSDTYSGNIRTVVFTITDANLSSYSDNNNKFIFDFKFYNSTMGDGYNLRDDFVLQDLSYDVELKGGSSYYGKKIYSGEDSVAIDGTTPIPLRVAPLYSVDLTGEITSSGFVEGTVQTGALNIVRNSASGTVTNHEILFLQTGSLDFVGNGTITPGSTNPNITFGTGTSLFFDNFDGMGAAYVFKTLFTLIDTGASYLDNLKDLRLNQYIRYRIDVTKNVTYLANVFNDNNTQSFETLKIYGLTNINENKQKDLVADQSEKDLQNIAGKIEKSSLKKDIRKKAINAVKFLDLDNGTKIIHDLSGDDWSNNTDSGKKVGDILYFGSGTGDNVLLGDGIIPLNDLEGEKIIIVHGSNLYVKSNVLNDSQYDLLGIIVLKDDLGRGGNLYIDPSVTELDAIIYTDKSIIGYNELYNNGNMDAILSHEIDGNIDSSSLDSQLYIYGSVFSENTIGGSRLAPPVCPFWTYVDPGFICDTIEAQKYDLNYLRSGISNKNNPAYGNYPVIIKYNSAVQSSSLSIFGE